MPKLSRQDWKDLRAWLREPDSKKPANGLIAINKLNKMATKKKTIRKKRTRNVSRKE